MKSFSRKIRRLSNSKIKILAGKKRKKTNMAPEKEEFVAGVVEGMWKYLDAFLDGKLIVQYFSHVDKFGFLLAYLGFYGRPWTFQQRKELFGR